MPNHLDSQDVIKLLKVFYRQDIHVLKAFFFLLSPPTRKPPKACVLNFLLHSRQSSMPSKATCKRQKLIFGWGIMTTKSSENESLLISWKKLRLSKLNTNLGLRMLKSVPVPFTMVPPEALSIPRKISWQLKASKQNCLNQEYTFRTQSTKNVIHNFSWKRF